MSIRCVLARLVGGIGMVMLYPWAVYAQVRDSIKLIQPLDDSTRELPSSPRIFIDYFNLSVGWIFKVAVGFTVVWVLIGGVMYMTSGDDQGRRGTAVSHMTWSIIGLLVLLFAGVLLRTLNSLFFIE